MKGHDRKSIVRGLYIGFRALALHILDTLTGRQLRRISCPLLPGETSAVRNGAFSGQRAGFVFLSGNIPLASIVPSSIIPRQDKGIINSFCSSWLESFLRCLDTGQSLLFLAKRVDDACSIKPILGTPILSLTYWPSKHVSTKCPMRRHGKYSRLFSVDGLT